MRDVRVVVGDRDEDRRERERDQRELPRDEEDEDRDADHREDVLEEEDQPVAEEEAHGLDVDRRARHQLARLVPVEVAERQPHELRVERRFSGRSRRRAPGCRRSAGGPSVAAALTSPIDEHGRDQPRQLGLVAVVDRVDDEPVSARERERSELADDGEHDRERRASACSRGGTRAGGRRSCGSAVSVPRASLVPDYAPGWRRRSSARTSAAASATRARFSGRLSQLLAPDGCGSGIATAPSSSSMRVPTALRDALQAEQRCAPRARRR